MLDGTHYGSPAMLRFITLRNHPIDTSSSNQFNPVFMTFNTVFPGTQPAIAWPRSKVNGPALFPDQPGLLPPALLKWAGTLLVLLFCTLPVQAQGTNDYALGNQLLRDGEFEEALEIFEQLMEENPRSFAVYDRTVRALISLQRFDDALEITYHRLENHARDINTMVKLGEIYHIAGDPEDAARAWDNVLDEHSGNPHAYRRIAETMNERRLYADAIEIYRQARQDFRDEQMYAFEMAGNYLATRNFEAALEEYLDILGASNQEMNRIQRQLLNYDERELYDTAILMTEERIDGLPPGSERDMNYRDFLVWLNMERGLYRRALSNARTMEQNSGNEQHMLFRVGRQLRSQQQFELAEEAFTYYLNLEQHSLQARSYEELSRTYQDWAGHLIDSNTDFGGAADTLYRKAFDTVDRLTSRYPRYDRIIQILLIQAELALDHLKEPGSAETYLERMEAAAESDSDQALLSYVEGRILLFRSDFSMARVAFTRSNRMAGNSEVAEKSRYYLGLGDFYNEDFTYSRLQLRSLERQNHSYFANNALQLRYMIQNALDDEDGAENLELKRYARARFLFDTGQYMEAAEQLAPVLRESATTKLHGESTLLMARVLRQIHPEIAFRVVDHQARRPSIHHNAGERLLWERARLAELNYVMQQRQANDGAEFTTLLIPSGLIESLFGSDDDYLSGGTHPSLTVEHVVEYYEELLMQHPDGYYSDIVRNRIRDLEQPAYEI